MSDSKIGDDDGETVSTGALDADGDGKKEEQVMEEAAGSNELVSLQFLKETRS